MSAPNNFRDDLDFSHQASQREFWLDAYHEFFVDLADYTTELPDDSPAQLNGIDRVLVLDSGKKVHIDEKARRKDYGDILLEVCSNDTTPEPDNPSMDGWMNKSMMIDYLAYGILPSRQMYMFPWDALRKAWVEHKDRWLDKAKNGVDGFDTVSAENPNYTTWSIAVPTETLLAAVSSAQVVDVPE